MIVTSLEEAQELYVLDKSVHGLLVMLHDPYRATVVQREIMAELGPGYVVRTWMQENSENPERAASSRRT